MKWTIWALAASVALTANARMVPAHRRNGLVKRQSVSVDGATENANATPSNDGVASNPTPGDAQGGASTQQTGILDGILPSDTPDNSLSLGQASSPNPLLPPVQSTTSTSTSRSTTALSSSDTALASKSTSPDVLTTNITSTQSNEASAAAQSDDDKDHDEGSGIGKKTLIIVISVASAVGLVAAIWTILRKWKFSPSRRFEERLNPIDWDPHTPEIKEEKVDRSPSIGSGSLMRQNSWGSSRGAAMSEVTGYTRPNPSAAHGFNGTAPGYPPSYSSRGYLPEMPQQYPSQQSLSNAYEYPSVIRQGAQVNGGRYGESYQ